MCICYWPCSWRGGDKSLCAKPDLPKASEKHGVKLRTKRLWRDVKAKLVFIRTRSFTNGPSTGDTKAAPRPGGGAQGDDIAPPPPSEKATTDGPTNKPTGRPSPRSLKKIYGSRPPQIIDIAIHKAGGGAGMLHRRALLKMESLENFMASDVQLALGISTMDAYDQGPMKVLDQEDVVPLGQVRAEWRLDAAGRTYSASFYVIDTDHFDVLLGGPVIKDYQLNKVVPQQGGLS